MQQNTGFRPEPLVIGDHWVAGTTRSIEAKFSGARTILQPNRSWLDYLPQGERQFILGKLDTQACVTFALLNAVEIYNRRKFGRTENYADRYLAKKSGTTPHGNDPHKVCETLRQEGVSLETQWPFTPDLDTWEKFYAAIPKLVDDEALLFPLEWDFSHQYVPATPTQLKDQLQYSPIPAAVFAYAKDENGLYYQPEGVSQNHMVVLVGMEEGKWWYIFDSYDLDQTGDFVKKVRWDTPFVYAKSFTIERNVQPQKEDAWQNFLKLIYSIISRASLGARKMLGI